jgi:hypothetical protein
MVLVAVPRKAAAVLAHFSTGGGAEGVVRADADHAAALAAAVEAGEVSERTGEGGGRD